MARAIRFGIAGTILIALGRLGATGRLPRNIVAGIRIPSTMRSDEAWLAGHQAAASALTAAGAGSVAVAAAAVTRPGRNAQTLLYRMGGAWLLAWLGLAIFQANTAARATGAKSR
ncbi:MAG TPA: SdpI family protein [Acidimicrobiales bacterium]|nr:SdpI family protein [Acidimicrobiales bacterium]